jgi:hypothetical protein
MPSLARNPEQNPELVPLNIIRVETALSRYPVHRLAKQGTIAIEIREESETGDVLIRWEVDHGKKYGQPGPLAYKLDTLIVNRRIEEASRPLPRIIKLGSLTSIIGELGLTNHDTQTVKKAFYQNAFAGITAKIRYRLADGSEKSLEAGFTRYAVVFTGEKLSDGRTADAVYLELSDRFMQIINGAQTRPLDYDYLRDLPPASQRFYELVSYQIYAAMKYGRARARLSYSEFCTHAPLTRFLKWDQVRPQMNRIHKPHKQSGYIASAEFEQTTDKEGRPDWLMLYTPGPKARAEYRAFTKKGGLKGLEIETTPATPEPKPEPKAILRFEPTQLELELINRGVTAATAREILAEHPEERIRRQIEHADFLVETGTREISNRGAYLAKAIRDDFAPPPGFEPKADREKRRAAEEAKRRQKQEEAQRRQAEEARERAVQVEILKYWNDLSLDEQTKLEAEALEQAEEELVSSYRQMQATRNPLAPMCLKHIREIYIRKLLGTLSATQPIQ